MNIHTDQELKRDFYALSEAQVKTKRQELAEMYVMSQHFDAKMKDHGYEAYASLHGALTEVLGELYHLPAYELMFFTWRYEPIAPRHVGDMSVRLRLYHNYGAVEGDMHLLSVTINCHDDDGDAVNVTDDKVDIEEVLHNDNSDEDSPTITAESVIWAFAGYLEELRVTRTDVTTTLLGNSDGTVLLGYRLENVSMFIWVNMEILDTYEEYCKGLGRQGF